jgi:ABC-type Fe3+/spermidine/putrescine transport system ATPase subunit
MTQISLRGLHKSFGATQVVRDLNLEIADREFLVLLGPSGCGKTTLLRCIAGFEDVSEGTILLEGRDIAGLAPNLRPVNTVFQHYALFPHMTVAGNVAFGLKMQGMAPGPRLKRAGEMLELVHLSAFADRLPSQLSGGQQQRVAVARALVGRPALILADEPTGNLDSAHGTDVMQMLRGLNEEGTTILMVTHSLEHAQYARRIVNMLDGHILTERRTLVAPQEAAA